MAGPHFTALQTRTAVYAELVRAARAGEFCPTNPALAKAIGARSSSVAVRAMTDLRGRGELIVSSRQGTRVVQIVALGLTIRSRKTASEIAGQVEAAAALARAAKREKLPPIVDRDPCFRCGVRRDIGCPHTSEWHRAALTTGAQA